MNFTCITDIKLPFEKAVEIFNDPGNFKYWQDGFVSMERISGIPGQAGAKSKLTYKMPKHEMVLVETIISNDLPREIKCLYEHTHMVNTMATRFTPIAANRTKYEVEIEYTKFNGIIPRLMALLMPGIFKKQTQKWMNQFKAFAEKQAIPGDSKE